MKNQVTFFLPLLLCFAFTPISPAQNLPASMAYSAPSAVRAPIPDGQVKLIVAGNTLIPTSDSMADLGNIPAEPETVAHRRTTPLGAEAVQTTARDLESSEKNTKLGRIVMLLGVMIVVYLATRKRQNQDIGSDVSRLQNFPKKRLADHEAHA